MIRAFRHQARPSDFRVDRMNNSEPLVLDSLTNRRAIRAINIFSFGCIFYYCLAQGSLDLLSPKNLGKCRATLHVGHG